MTINPLKTLSAALFLALATPLQARVEAMLPTNIHTLPTGETITVQATGPHSYRVRATAPGATLPAVPYYVDTPAYQGTAGGSFNFAPDGAITFADATGTPVLTLEAPAIHREEGHPRPDMSSSVSQTFRGPQGESLFGTGQFQDGYLDVNGLTRRLTQVNTQIAMPMVISNKGYGILWNNSGLTDFNPASTVLTLTPGDAEGESVTVDATGTEGNRREQRTTQTFVGTLDIPADGEYSLMLDCGQSMSRKHYLAVDGKVLTKADNVWLPPTTSVKTHLTKGRHSVEVQGDRRDTPTLHWRQVDGSNTFASPVAQGIDYTVFIGTPDEIIAEMRQLTGQVPMMPKWAFGYIHCRERFDNQAELLDNATHFRELGIPVDIIVQDWQWWGKNGWNAMVFDSEKYPDPKAMTDSLHNMDMRLMLSVWAKIDKNSALGQQFSDKGYYIPNTDWVDFFSPEAADAYWKAYRENLLPTGIDAWWQDATEPENDDLHGRMVANGTIDGETVRDVFALTVNDRVYKGLTEDRPGVRPMIMTRSGSPGIQRYGVMTWSGDVGNDWQTLQRQIAGGLGQMVCGVPWWTYDAGGFFRPGDQYQNSDYQQRMLRWIQTAVYLPFMRVHGYMSQTEPWRYSSETCDNFTESIRQRYRLMPYIYSEAARVSTDGSTLMRPLVFDFADDVQAMRSQGGQPANVQYMFGPSLLVCPVTAEGNIMHVYLPATPGGWYDLYTGRHYAKSGTEKVMLSEAHIPVYAKSGTILPCYEDVTGVNSTVDLARLPELTIRVYPGADGSFTLYDDDGVSTDSASRSVALSWDDARRTLTIDKPQGKYPTSIQSYRVVLPDGTSKTVKNKNKTIKISL